MKTVIRSRVATLACLWLVGSALGQDDLQRPFVEFPDPVAGYLKRIHSSAAAPAGAAALAFRSNYPGGFTAWQRDARKKLSDLLGLDRMRQESGDHQPSVRLESPIKEEGYQRQRGAIETESGVTIPFWLLTPLHKSTSLRPLAICAHGHDSDGWNTYAGDYRDDEHRNSTRVKDGDVGVQAVKRGFVTLVPATRGLAASVSIPDLKGRHGRRDCRAQLIHCLLAGRTAVGERVWDVQRILDWALSKIPGIDPTKVVLLGNSGGGVLTVYVAALDERVSVAVPSCSFTSYTSDTGFVFHCDCCLVPRAQVELGDMTDIGGLTAPRPLLAVHGRKDGLHSFPDVEAAMSHVRLIYAAAGAPNHFRHEWGASGHKFYPDIMWPFIQSALK
ncbi:MAG: alpha/beta hydrolase [Fuerstiella sp.]|nr:alpha/beta hydrolase [Fuerstiella sp.]